MNDTLHRRSLLLAGASLAVGCRRPTPGSARPLVLVFGPSHAPRQRALLQQRLAERSGLALELRPAASSGEAIDLVQAGQADGGLLSLFDFLFCHGVFDVEPLVQLVRAGGPTQSAELLVRAGSNLTQLTQLGGRKVGFVDPFSVSGYLLVAAMLGESKVSYEPVFLGSHEAVLSAVAEGRVDAGASYDGQAASRPGLSVLSRSREVANEPLFVQASVGPEARAALRGALLAEQDPALLAGLAGATGLQAVPPGTYEGALATLKAAGLRVEETIQGGWQRANHYRRPAWALDP